MTIKVQKRQMMLVIIGILLLIVVAGVAFYAINFLVNNVKTALDRNLLETQKITRFNLEGLTKIGLIK